MTNTVGKLGSAVCLMALGACMGGGGDTGGDSAPVLSSGIITVEIVDTADYNALPSELQTIVDDVVISNTQSGAATQPASGTTNYAGSFGMGGFQDLPDISGTAALSVDPSATVTYTFTPTDVADTTFASATVSGTMTGSNTVAAGLFDGSLSGTMTYDEDGSGSSHTPIAISVSGSVNGAFDSNLDGFGGMTLDLSATGLPANDGIGLFHTTLQ